MVVAVLLILVVVVSLLISGKIKCLQRRQTEYEKDWYDDIFVF